MRAADRPPAPRRDASTRATSTGAPAGRSVATGAPTGACRPCPGGADAPAPRPAPGEADATVVIATRDRADRLAATLARLRATTPRAPVLVCDDASRDAAAVAAVAAAAGAALLRLEHAHGAAARDAGVRAARTPFVAFCDDDSWWAPGALGRAVHHLDADPTLGLVAAHVLVGPDERPDPTTEAMARSPLGRAAAGPLVLGFVACAVVARRDALLRTPGFPARYGIGGEEAPLAIDLARAGWRLVHAPDVVAHHHPERRPATTPRAARTLRNDLWTAWRRRSVRVALRQTWSVAARAPRDVVARRALAGALPGLGWALRDRRAPGRELEDGLRALDAQRAARVGRLPDDPAHDVRPARGRTDGGPADGGRAADDGRAADRQADGGQPDGGRARADVTVVVCTRDRWPALDRTLRELAALPEDPPVIVVDDASTDGTPELLARHHPHVEVVVLRERRGPVARNVGVRRARTPYVAFADDDSWWAPGDLARAAAVLDDHPRIGVLTARILVGPEGREDPISPELARSPLGWDDDLPGHALASFMGGASIVRRGSVVEVGGFEPRLVVGGEEQLLGAELVTAGWAMRYLPGLTVHHHPEGERRGEVRALGVRNALWFVWRRRSVRAAAAESAFVLRSSGLRPEAVRGTLRALAGAGWVLRTRRPVPPWVERGMRLLDADRRTSRAVDYGA